MLSRAMIVVGGGTSSRFGGDKLMETIAGVPLIIHTLNAISPLVERCVLVCRPDQQASLHAFGLDVTIVPGGASRTESEMAGLAALNGEFDLIGVHDGARPLVDPDLVERLFEIAGEVGGAVPVLDPGHMVVDRLYLRPMVDVVTVQTPQVFRGPELMAAFVRAARTDFEGHDTVDVVQRFASLEIAAVPGDPANLKVTFPQDLDQVRSVLEGPSRIEPR